MINNKRPLFFTFRTAKKLQRPSNCSGQTLVEYALILAFISVVAISVLLSLGTGVKKLYLSIDSQVDRAPGGVNYVAPGG